MKVVEIAVRWKCDYCGAMFDSRNQCEAHERAFCTSRPDLKRLAEECRGKWYASADECKVFKIRYYDWDYGYFVCMCYGSNNRILIGYTIRLSVDDVITAHMIDVDTAKDLIGQYSDEMMELIE